MQPFTTVSGAGVVLARDNIDTDQLIPARFMKRTRSEGYGDQLLHDLRFREDGAPVPDFPLNRMAERPVLMVAGENFGCGSSREAAVYALVDAGSEEEAHRHAPRDRSRGMKGSFYGQDDTTGHYRLVRDADGDMWRADWPLFFVDFDSASAYAAWLSRD